ncbi:beta-lactamase family protein, partial [Myxococcota bacterium]|nr:beta-lactamase family protein [Myxococcota bacterium]
LVSAGKSMTFANGKSFDFHKSSFEIGSITKVFNGQIMAVEMREKGLFPTDKIDEYITKRSVFSMPAGITFAELANHSSGLTRLPSNMNLNSKTPYTGYSIDKLKEYLKTKPTLTTRGKYSYSNLGSAVLGLALEGRTGISWENLLKERILNKIGMKHTAITTPAGTKLLQGHMKNEKLEETPPWDFEMMAPCGAIRSTPADMMKYLKYWIESDDAKKNLEKMLMMKIPVDGKFIESAMGWHVFKAGKLEIIWHDGGTYGFSSFIGFIPEIRTGIIIMANSFNLKAPIIKPALKILVGIYKNTMKKPAVKTEGQK